MPYDDGYIQASGGGLFGDLFGRSQQQALPGLLNGGGDIDTDRLMNALIRRQLEQSMQPNFGAFAAALGKAAQPSLLPKSVGAALAEASGALSGGNDANELKALQGLKLLQDMKNARAEQALRGQLPGMIQKGLDVVRGYTTGGPQIGGGTGTGGTLAPGGGAATGESKSGGLGYGQLTQLALDAGFPAEDAPIMAAISMGESSGNPNAKNITDRERSYGITQINALAHPGGEKALGDPVWAMQKAKELYDARRERGQRGFEDWSVYTNGAYRQHLQGALAAQPAPYSGGQSVPPTIAPQLAAVPDFTGRLGGVTDEAPAAAGPLAAALTQKQQYDADVAAGRRPALPPGTQFNRRGEAISGDLRAVLPGQQSGPNISADVLRGFAQANTGGSGGGIPAAVALEPGGGGDDGGGLTGAGGVLGGGRAAPPVPGLMAAPPAAPAAPAPVPGVLATPPTAAAPPAYAVPATPNIPSAIPKPPPLPDTRQTQEVLAAIAAMRAQTQALKLGDPFGALHDAITQSPRFRAEQEAVKKAAEYPYELDLIRQRTEEAVRQGRMLHPLEIDKIFQQGQQARETALAGMGLRRNPQTGEVERDPGFAPAKAATEGLIEDIKARKQAAQRETEIEINGEKHKVTAEEAGQYARGEGIERLGIQPRGTAAPGSAPGAPGASPLGGTPSYTETEKGIQKYVAENFGTQHKAALDAASSISQIHDARRLIDRGIFAGKTGPLDLEIARIGKALGVTGKDTNEQIANTQTFLIGRSRDTLNLIRALGANPSNTDRIFAEKIAAGDISLDPETLRRVLDTQERLNREVVRRFNELAGGPNVVRATGGRPMTVEPPSVYKGRTGKGQDGSTWYTDETGQWVQEK